jgi:hypothetical protein
LIFALSTGIVLNRYLTNEKEDKIVMMTPVSFERELMPDEELFAELKILKPCRVNIYLDEVQWKSGQLDPGSYVFQFFEKARIFVEDGSLVELTWRGWNHGLLGAPGRKRLLHLVRTID